jgi:hypothetical protein
MLWTHVYVNWLVVVVVRQSETMVVVVGGWVGLALALTGAVLLMGSSVIIGRDDDCEQSVVDD